MATYVNGGTSSELSLNVGLVATYDQEVLAHPEGLLVRQSGVDVELLPFEGDTMPSGTQANDLRLDGYLLASAPDFVVGTNGDFLRVEMTDEFRDRQRRLVDELARRGSPAFGEAAKQVLERMLSGDHYAEGLRAEWQQIARLRGLELREGSPLEGTSSMLPALADEVLSGAVRSGDIEGSYRYLGPIRCDGSDTGDSCAEVSFRAEPPETDQEAFDYTVSLTVDPATLRPYRRQTELETMPTDSASPLAGTMSSSMKLTVETSYELDASR